MLNNLILTCLIVTILFQGTFFLSLALIYQSIEKKALNIRNTFIFESAPGFKEKNSFINYLFLFALIVNLFPFIFYLSKTTNSYTISIAIFATLAMFCLASLPFISINKLREHLYLDLGALVSLLALFGFEAFYSFNVYKYSEYTYNYALAAMIISIFFALILLVSILNPKLFDFKNVQNEDGTYSRKKFIFLAFVEWILYPLGILSLLPIFLLTMK